MADGTVHIVGAGLAGLSAAVSLVGTGRRIVVHELAPSRRRPLPLLFRAGAWAHDRQRQSSPLIRQSRGARLSAKQSAVRISSPQADEAAFAFADLASGERWVLRPNEGSVPWWIFSSRRRVPGTHATRLFVREEPPASSAGSSVSTELIDCDGPLYERLLRPLFLAALNTEPSEASAFLAGAILRETLARGGRACRPLVAPGGLGPAFIDPALAYLERHGVMVRFRSSASPLGACRR